MGPIRKWLRNGIVAAVAEKVKAETDFSPTSFWDSSWGGSGYYIWGYGSRSPGPGMSITPEIANAQLAAGIRTAVDEFTDIFQFCPVDICEVRMSALVRLLYYAGLPRFMRMHKMIAAIFKGDWDDAAYQLRSDPWYDDNGQKARTIVSELRDCGRARKEWKD